MTAEEIRRLKASFMARKIQVVCFDTLAEAKAYLLDAIPQGSTVGIGHSATLQKMHITLSLMDKGMLVYDKELASSKEESKAIKKRALLADCYITGANAVSMDGRIVSVDHSGNRVAAMAYGPDKVFVVVGINKITDTWEEAIKRVKNIASPMNASRAGYHPPCVMAGHCVDCTSGERVCNMLSIIEGQADPNRMTLCIVKEAWGF